MANGNLNILVENKIPYIEGVLEPYGRVRYLSNDEITADVARDADAIFGRTRTAYGPAMLSESRCRFVATATIGTDQIDIPWCEAHGIEVANAPGCNAPAVAQYVLASLMQVVNRPISQHTIAVVGVGNVGSIVARWAKALDMNVLLVDPPRARREGAEGFVTLAEAAAQADIITFHTPLTREGDDPTWHLADEAFFTSLRRMPIIVNAARGAVIDTQALIAAIDSGTVGKVIVDTWEGEPALNTDLLKRTAVATPHIAGYSIEGKQRATAMTVAAFAKHFGLALPAVEWPGAAPEQVSVREVIRSYNPLDADDPALRAHPELFEQMRDSYALRREIPASRPD